MLIIAAVLVIVALAIYFRSYMLQFYGFFEPDGFYYFSVMRATVNNGFAIPHYLSTSGWPSPQPVAEAHGIYWMTLLPYAVLQFFGVSYYTIMRLVPMLFAVLDMFGAYLLSRYLSKDKVLGLLVILFVALSMGNAARTSAIIYRGDTFITFFLIMALVFFVEIFRQDDRKKKMIFTAAAAIALACCNMVWTGAGFADAVFLFAFVALMAFAFVLRKEGLLNDGMYAVAAIALWFIISSLAQAVGFIGVEQGLGLQYLPIYAAGAVFWLILYLISTRALSVMRLPQYRLGALLLILAISATAFVILASNFISNLLIANGFGTATGSFASTTQELQKPDYNFLYTSFGPGLYTSIPALVLTASQVWFVGIWYSLSGVLGVLVILLCFIPYFLMQIYDSGGFLNGSAKIKFDVNVSMVALMSYFLFTAYLQMQAIRFNSIISIPIAIMSAYTIYWLVAASNKLQTKTVRMACLGVSAVVIIFIIYLLLYYANIYSSQLTQADSINPAFISAMQWLKANSPSSSVVLTLWPDGSVVEAVANRTTVMDSVGAENGSKATPFAAWLLNSSPDPSFLTGPLMASPNYLVVRNSWLIETQGIYTEADINVSSTLFGYAQPVSLSEEGPNSSTRLLIFRTVAGQSYPAIVLAVKLSNTTGQVNNLFSYLQPTPSQSIPFSRLVLSNQNTGNLTIINQSAVYNNTNGDTFFIQYSTGGTSGGLQNITAALLFAPGIGNSNLAKTLFMCSSTYCAWNNNRATMKEVFANPDTKIFKITYNNTG